MNRPLHRLSLFSALATIATAAAPVPSIGERTHVALADISKIVRAQLDATCPLDETYDEILRDGADGLP